MKRLLIAGLALVTILSLTGCGVSSSRGGLKANKAAASGLSGLTGEASTLANSEMYALETTGLQASGYGINAENFLGTGNVNANYTKIGIAINVNKAYTVAAAAIVFTSAEYEDTVNLIPVGTISGSPTTGLIFVAQDFNGVKVNITAMKYGTNMIANIKLASSSALFAQSTPLSLVVAAQQ